MLKALRLKASTLVVLATCSALLCARGWSSETDYALLAPRAATSLLLDIAGAGERLVAVGERGHILYSDDGATTWEQVRAPTSVMLTRVFFANAEDGWAVGHDGNILATSDGGMNWSLQRDGISDQALVNEERAARAKRTLAELRKKHTQSGDGPGPVSMAQIEQARYDMEVALEVLDEPVYAPPLMDIWFTSDQDGWASGAYGVLLHTANGGRSWQDWSHKVSNPDELHFNGVTGDNTGALYLASEWGYVFRSLNGGGTWEAMETGYDGSFFGIVANLATDSLFAYGLLGNIYRSSDRGESWEALATPVRSSLFGALSRDSGELLFVGLGGTVLRTTDDGNSFSQVMLRERRDLLGISALPDGRLAVTGDGGSEALDHLTKAAN